MTTPRHSWASGRLVPAAIVGGVRSAVLRAALMLAVPATAAYGQENAGNDPGPASDTTGSGTTLVPLPVLFYQPETGTGFGAVVNYYFRIGSGEDDRPLLPSSVSLIGIYTTKNQILSLLQGELFPSAGRFRILGRAGYTKFPTKFWGIGNDTPESAEEDYTPETVDLSLDVQRELREGLFVGFTARIAHRRLTQVDSAGSLATRTVPGSADGRIVGAGFLTTWDTRTSTVYPTSGSFHQARATLHHGAIGSQFDFTSVTLDLRRYATITGRHIVALRALGVATAGTPPFDLLPQLGGDALLRGYFQGRFRDKDLLALQAEYRTLVWWRIGLVGFVGAGQVSSSLDALELDGFKLTAGGGLRFLLSPQEGLNVRLDFGWGFDVNSSGFYMSLGEAF